MSFRFAPRFSRMMWGSGGYGRGLGIGGGRGYGLGISGCRQLGGSGRGLGGRGLGGRGLGYGRRGGGFGRFGGGMYYGDRDMPLDRYRSPFCRYDDWMANRYGDFDGVPSRMRDSTGWFNWSRWRPWWLRDDPVLDNGGQDVSVKFNDKVYEVSINVEDFHPEDLELKITGNRLVITGKSHTEQDDLGTMSQEFTRQFSIPEGVDVDSIQSTLTDDGRLVIKGILKESPDAKARFINIERQ